MDALMIKKFTERLQDLLGLAGVFVDAKDVALIAMIGGEFLRDRHWLLHYRKILRRFLEVVRLCAEHHIKIIPQAVIRAYVVEQTPRVLMRKLSYP
jgi:hypothetical protein